MRDYTLSRLAINLQILSLTLFEKTPDLRALHASGSCNDLSASGNQLILRAATLAVIPAGGRPAGGTCPVATVVISGAGEGDQPVESPEVKVSVGWAKAWSDPPKEASNSTGCSKGELIAPKRGSHRKRIGGAFGSAEPLQNGRRPASLAKELGTCS
jgi:hypothetical protein